MKPRAVSLHRRVDAVVAATRIVDGDRSPSRESVWLLTLLSQRYVDMARIRQTLDGILAAGASGCEPGDLPYCRLRVAKFEAVLGLDQHPLSAEAAAAWDESRGRISHIESPWLAYVRRLAAEAGVSS
ncbi:hypothetical protein GJ689_23285 [Rhodoplanes serenus]|uniref:Uncharacterized protein n=1 Tax=Rhodoplanes serenus TaxID=200615 RepID=A0A9X5ATY9_9BRAD|nr:hypothetical protein [Rhodoplanes serenus]MTW19127.1 hypothetical protein [Rhodoplanes serenus]